MLLDVLGLNTYTNLICATINIKTHNGESRGRDQRVSYLQVVPL